MRTIEANVPSRRPSRLSVTSVFFVSSVFRYAENAFYHSDFLSVPASSFLSSLSSTRGTSGSRAIARIVPLISHIPSGNQLDGTTRLVTGRGVWYEDIFFHLTQHTRTE